MHSLADICIALILLTALLWAGLLVRAQVDVFRSLFLPVSVIAGALGRQFGWRLALPQVTD